MSTRWIALLRGVNVGGAKKVPMAQLRELLEGLGFADVSTYVQSGNAVFTAEEDDPRAVAERIEAAIEDAFGFGSSITMRTRDELAAVIDAHPLRDVVTADNRFHVMFLSDEAPPDALAAIDAKAHEPELFVLAGRELYLWTPAGLGTSRLAPKLTEKRLGTTATTRNWRTVEKLLELADAAG